MLENWQQGFRLAALEPGMVTYFAFSFGPFLGFWTAFEAGVRYGLRCIPGGGASTQARVRAIIEHGAEVLCCTPTYALHLADVAKNEGVQMSASRVRKILVAGEPGGSLPVVRARLEEAWPGAKVYDHYGMTEVGPVAFAKDGMDGALRVLEERYYVEVLTSCVYPRETESPISSTRGNPALSSTKSHALDFPAILSLLCKGR